MILKKLTIIIAFILGLFIAQGMVNANKKEGGTESMNSTNAESTVSTSNTRIVLVYNGNKYSVTTENNPTVKALSSCLPLTMNMTELNGNEKYHNLSSRLPSKDIDIKRIRKGDLMLYSSHCIVLFYKDFDTTYRYTRIGHVDSFDSIADSLGRGNITITLKNGTE